MAERSKTARLQAGKPGLRRESSAGRRWWATHGRDVRFLAVFGFFLALFYGVGMTPYVQDRLVPEYLRLNASASASLLSIFGEEAITRDKTVVGKRFSITIERGCDAIQPSALFCSAVLASPVPWLARGLAVLAGTSILMVLNFVRIMSLCYVKAYFPGAFDVMHLDVWQALFIFLAILLWAFWAAWQSRRSKAVKTHAAVQNSS